MILLRYETSIVLISANQLILVAAWPVTVMAKHLFVLSAVAVAAQVLAPLSAHLSVTILLPTSAVVPPVVLIVPLMRCRKTVAPERPTTSARNPIPVAAGTAI